MTSYYTNEQPNKTPSVPDQLVIQAFAKVDKVALGLASGFLGAVGIFLATVILLIKGGNPVGPNLALLGQYFIGYTVSWKGSVVGALYGFLFGFALGWSTAFLRNLFVALYVYTVKLKASLMSLNDFIEHQ
jgi:hypothetical protein